MIITVTPHASWLTGKAAMSWFRLIIIVFTSDLRKNKHFHPKFPTNPKISEGKIGTSLARKKNGEKTESGKVSTLSRLINKILIGK